MTLDPLERSSGLDRIRIKSGEIEGGELEARSRDDLRALIEGLKAKVVGGFNRKLDEVIEGTKKEMEAAISLYREQLERIEASEKSTGKKDTLSRGIAANSLQEKIKAIHRMAENKLSMYI